MLAAGQSRMAESALPAPFTVPFSLPPKAVPVKSVGTTDYYSLVMREQATEIIPGYQTRIWGYNGTFPGPTFDVQQGRETVVRQANRLPQSHPTLGYTPFTSVHLHGSASLPQYDGYASDVTYPGSARTTTTRTSRTPARSGTTTTACTTPRRTSPWAWPACTGCTTPSRRRSPSPRATTTCR